MSENFEFRPLTKGLGFHKKSTFIDSKTKMEDIQSIDHPILDDKTASPPVEKKLVKKPEPFNYPQYQNHLGTRPKSQIEFSVEKNIFEIEKTVTKSVEKKAPSSTQVMPNQARMISVTFDCLLALFVWFTCLALLIYFFQIPLSEIKTWWVLGGLLVASLYGFRVAVVLLLNKTFGEILTNLELVDIKTKKQISNFKAFQRANFCFFNGLGLFFPGLLIKLISKKQLDEILGLKMNRNDEWLSKNLTKSTSST